MPRLQPAQPHGLDLIRRLTYRTARRVYGRETDPLLTMAHHRPLMVGLGLMGTVDSRYSHAVAEHLKHLARLRAAQLVGCEWCLDFGSYLAQQAGGDEQQLRELATWRESERFDTDERLVLEYTEAITRTPAEVSDALFARVRDRFDDRQIVELTMAVALENLYSRFNWALGIEGEGFSEGMYCVMPQSGHTSESNGRLAVA
jgi:AhpD family alkylhydroperoxidase